MPARSKRGSSRRKGDEYQDLTALRLILELYIARTPFKVFLEYENAKAVDDIMTSSEGRIRALQVKYAIDPLAVYRPEDFTNPSSRTYFGRFANGWRQMRALHPNAELNIELVSNRGRDSTLEPVIASDGCFTEAFIDGRLRGDPRRFRESLQAASGFSGADGASRFQDFLRAFRFVLRERPLAELQMQICAEILDHHLGISDAAVFFELKDLVERHAIELHGPITPEHINTVLLRAQGRFLLPQIFPVDHAHFVAVPDLGRQLDAALADAAGGYVVVTGLPGSGKSTSLSKYFDQLEQSPQLAVCRYYCFVDPNDDAQRLRLEADALRTNLLAELHNRFGDWLNRRHDYGERNFISTLATLGRELSAHGRRLAVLLDGLDHAERDPLVHETVIRALPPSLPDGVIFIIGTQELKNWEPFTLREARARRHVQMPLFSLQETRTYLIERHGLALDEAAVARFHAKSEGLPLYLHYIAARLAQAGSANTDIDALPAALGGDIRTYYGRLWANLDRDEMSHARHLCGVLAVLRFPVREEELPEFQDQIPRVMVAEAVRAIAHLLRREDGAVSIFHDSFRVFVNAELPAEVRRLIARAIFTKLKGERGSPRWFTHAFRYALECGEEEYLLQEVNRPFVDFALRKCRPAAEILRAIEDAGDAAARREDLVALARLGSLQFRTEDRLRDQFDYSGLARALLPLNRANDVLGFCCHPKERRWLVDLQVAMQVMIWCAESNRKELGDRLFDVFRKTHGHHEWNKRWEIVQLARVLGIYSKNPAVALRFLSRFKFDPDVLDRPEHLAPAFAPHLAAFLESYFVHQPAGAWRRLKRVGRLFPNRLVRHLLLRLALKHGSRAELAAELEDFFAHYTPGHNQELAGLAAMAGLPVARVREIAGPVHLPPRKSREADQRVNFESSLDEFEWTALVLGYEDDVAACQCVAAHIGSARTMWSGFLQFLLLSGLCLGRAAAQKARDYFKEAREALRALAGAGTKDDPHEYDVLRACRPLLPEMLARLTRLVAEKSPERLDQWRDELLALRNSELWTSHWSIGEVSVDYSFELRVWERLAELPAMRSRLRPILLDCSRTYRDATALKAGSRSEHFLRLAAIAGRCGWRDDAEAWIDKGIACSLTYGYRKDTTLDNLVDVLELLNRFEPEHGLARSAAILEMVKWMGEATDGRGTKYFEQSVFRVILQTSREAALELIRFFREEIGRWKMLDCLEKYVLARADGDVEVLWTLKDAFAPHFHERGRHLKQVIRVVRHTSELGKRYDPAQATAWQQRFTDVITTHIDPNWWPQDVWDDVCRRESRTPRHAKDPDQSSHHTDQSEFTLDGMATPRAEVERRLNESIDSFFTTLEKLRAENSYFYDRDLINPALRRYVAATMALPEMGRIADAADAAGDLVSSDTLRDIAHRFFEFGANDEGFERLLRAYQNCVRYYSGSEHGQPYLEELCGRDRQRVAAFLAEQGASALRSDYGGFDLPRMIARYFAACGDKEKLRMVFSDYLQHCEELFAHMPTDARYAWLKNFRESSKDESVEVVNLLVDLLSEPELDQAQRLVRALGNLAKARPELVCRIACQRYAGAEGLLRERLGAVMETLAVVCAAHLAPHLGPVAPVLAEPDFQQRILLMAILRRVHQDLPLKPTLSAVLEEAHRDYYPVIPVPSAPLILAEPSSDFVRFLQSARLFDFERRLQGICELLRIAPEVVLSYIERNLQADGWTQEAECERLKQDWRQTRHHHRVVLIASRFHTRVSQLLRRFVHEAVKKPVSPAIIEALWGVLRLCDPAYCAVLPQPKPSDIPALEIGDANEWLSDQRGPTPFSVEVLRHDGWTTLYEVRHLSQTEEAHPKFVLRTVTCTLLIAPELSDAPERWPDPTDWADSLPVVHPSENLTCDAVRERMTEIAEQSNPEFADFAPTVAVHLNGDLFHGFPHLAALASECMAALGLSFRGYDLFADGKQETAFDVWQEGYEDEVDSRELLSHGVRLRIRNTALRKVLQEQRRALAICDSEQRFHFNSWWRPEPAQVADRIELRTVIGDT